MDEGQVKSQDSSVTSYRNRFLVRKGQKWIVIPVYAIAWFKVERKICFIKTRDNRRFVIDHPLDELTGILDPDLFFRINRSYILDVNSIQSISPYFGGKLLLEIEPRPENELVIVSKEKAMEVKKWLGK